WRALRARAQACPELGLRVRDRGGCAYPVWERRAVDDGQFVVHELDGSAWTGCLDAVAALASHQLDAREVTWRLHLFAPVDVPAAAVAGRRAAVAEHAGGPHTPSTGSRRRGRTGCTASRFAAGVAFECATR